jgi:thiamine biosynthesis lipoprotein
MSRVGTALIALALVPTLSTAAEIARARYLMGTVCEVAAGGDAAEQRIAAAFAEAARIEQMLSTWRADSELSRLNAGDADAASPELRALLAAVDAWRARTGGAFEPRIRPLLDAWRTRDEGAVPAEQIIVSALQSIRGGKAAIEEGAFGKGYAIDRMLEHVDFVNFGGQIGVRGRRTAAIAHPARRDEPLLELMIADASLSTSSGSEKTFRAGNRIFTHIIDPRNGRALPPRGSVSVVAASAFEADILSTALYVMGPEEGLPWADAQGVAAVFITPDLNVRTSAAFRRLKE